MAEVKIEFPDSLIAILQSQEIVKSENIRGEVIYKISDQIPISKVELLYRYDITNKRNRPGIILSKIGIIVCKGLKLIK